MEPVFLEAKQDLTISMCLRVYSGQQRESDETGKRLDVTVFQMLVGVVGDHQR